jgi:hypothetical protein
MYVDSDIVVPVGAFGVLWQTMQDTKAQVVSGRYYQRGYPFANVWMKRHEHRNYHCDGGLVEDLDACGMGCVLIDRRWVSKELEKPLFKSKLLEENLIGAEDYYFCDKVKEKGGKIIGTTKVDCGHGPCRLMISTSNVNALRKMEIERGIDKGSIK